MKRIAFLSAMAAAAFAAAAEDPTVPEDELAGRLVERVAESPGLSLHALVVGADDDGVALVGPSPAAARICRRGSVIPHSIDGVDVGVEILSVTSSGVKLAAGRGKDVFLAGSYKPLPPDGDAPPEFIRYIECANVPLSSLLRLVSDQTGVNISSSESASGKAISIFLRNVTADAAVEEICRTSGLWFRRDGAKGVVRVTTMEEYSENLDTFREEATEMFTLLYPNVVEVAGVIYGLHPDRTFLSLGEEDIEEDDENDLSRRFRRFRMIEENGGSQFLDMEPPSATSSGASSGNGNFSFSRGNALSRITQWDQLRRRGRGEGLYGGRRGAVAADDAKLLEFAWRSGDTNLLQVVRNQISPAAANIFVTMSRKNNMLAVRTSDLRVMDEIRALVKKLDVPTPMVLMEVKVLELNITDDYEAGFKWGLTDIINVPERTVVSTDADGNAVSTTTPGGRQRIVGRSTSSVGHQIGNTANIFADIAQTGMTAINPTFAFQILSDKVAATIQLMQKDGKVKTLSTPTLLVANNEVSRIFSGKEYPLVSGWTAGDSVVSEGGIVTTDSTVEIEKKDVGTMLLITPNINADRTVTIRMLQENSEVSAEKVSIPVTGSTTSNGDVRPIEYVESRQLAGTFVAKDGMTVMAGGLIRESEETTYWRTPVLGSIPLVGWLFRGTEKAKVRTELVVLIRPHVISTPIEGGRISAELMEALSAHPAKDGRQSMGVFNPDKEHSAEDDVQNIVK